MTRCELFRTSKTLLATGFQRQAERLHGKGHTTTVDLDATDDPMRGQRALAAVLRPAVSEAL